MLLFVLTLSIFGTSNEIAVTHIVRIIFHPQMLGYYANLCEVLETAKIAPSLGAEQKRNLAEELYGKLDFFKKTRKKEKQKSCSPFLFHVLPVPL